MRLPSGRQIALIAWRGWQVSFPLLEYITNPSEGMDELPFKGVIDFGAQAADGDFDHSHRGMGAVRARVWRCISHPRCTLSRRVPTDRLGDPHLECGSLHFL